jgi:acyl CoA:acetate/3-ketoacid CoA transferase alpha subunit
VATAASTTVVEADRLVGRGEIDPDDVHLPGIYVTRVFEAREHDNVIEHRTTRGRKSEETSR